MRKKFLKISGVITLYASLIIGVMYAFRSSFPLLWIPLVAVIIFVTIYLLIPKNN
jgi:hypothetical protein